MARAAMLLVLALAVLTAPAATNAFQCPTLALQVAPLQAACADATTVCTACVSAIAKQLEPAFQTALAQGVAMLNASMADIQSCLFPIVMPALPSVPNLAGILACPLPTGPELLAAAAAALNGTATGDMLADMQLDNAAVPSAAPAGPLTAASLLTALSTVGALPSAPAPKAAPQESSSRSAAMPTLIVAAALLAAMA